VADSLDDQLLPLEPRRSLSRAHAAAFMLLLATVAWGFGFTWAKVGGETLNARSGLVEGSALGPVLLLAVRFLVAAVVMLVLVPAARSGWTTRSIGRSLVLGSLMGLGMILQHLGLDRSSEAVIAFLTSLTILFVPILMTFVLRRPPRPIFWAAVALATLGIWMMTGATPAGFGVGELLGLLCAIVFSIYLIAINALVPRDDPWRMTVGQFLVAGGMTLGMCLFVEGGPTALTPRRLIWLFAEQAVWLNVLLLVIFPTLYSYTAMNIYQPRIDPTRAALIYLMEPLFAAAYAYLARGRTLDWQSLAGAALILTANLLVEFLTSRKRSRPATMALAAAR
jgi:drug/metabolite transporter (DMT)-like permease